MPSLHCPTPFSVPQLFFMFLITPEVYLASRSSSVWLRKQSRKEIACYFPGAAVTDCCCLAYLMLFQIGSFFHFLCKGVNPIARYYGLFCFLGRIIKTRKLILPLCSVAGRPQWSSSSSTWKALADWRESSGRSLGWSGSGTNLEKETLWFNSAWRNKG